MDNLTDLLAFLGEDGSDLPENFSIDDFLTVAANYKTTDRWFEPKAELALVLLFCFVILCGLAGNLVVCVVLCRNGNLKTSRNWYILNLSVCELMTCIMCMPFVLVRLTLKNWNLGLVLCKLVPTLQTTYVAVSTFTIVAIAVDRYRAIVCAVTKSRHKKKTRTIIPLTWIVGTVVAIPQLLTHRIEDVFGVTGTIMYSICVEHWDSNELLMCYTVAVLILQYLVPVLAIIALHVLICQFLSIRTSNRQISLREVTRVKRNLACHRKNMYLLSSIAALFAVTGLPLTLVNILADFDQAVFQNQNFRLIHAICMLVALCSVCINPVVYGWFNSNFRRQNNFRTSARVSTSQSVDMVQYLDTRRNRTKTVIIPESSRRRNIDCG